MTTNNINAVESANAKIESIKQSIIGGDKTLTSADLSRARAELEFCELQQEARAIAEEKAIEVSRRANLLDLQKQLAGLADTKPILEKKFTAFERTLADYLAAVAVYHRGLQSIRDSLQNGGFTADTGISVGASGEIGNATAVNIIPGETIERLVERLLAEFNQNLRTKRT